tara:strand:+ start:50337 stop:50666 length:330 start_codon:yes stop_codon:yes gene_type:complete
MHKETSNTDQNYLNSNTAGLLDRLVDIHELGEILGYDDVRSVRSWCKRSSIPLFLLGKRTYTVSNLLDQYLGDLLGDNLIPANDSIAKDNMRQQGSNMSEASKKFLNEE